jgi:TPR repeat protein
MPKDSKELIRLAGKGVPDAQAELADRSFFGIGVAEDTSRAVKLWRQAAESGNAQAQYKLAAVLYYGELAERDYEAAYFWILQAEFGGIAEAGGKRELIAKKLSPEVQGRVKARAKKWRESRDPRQ